MFKGIRIVFIFIFSMISVITLVKSVEILKDPTERVMCSLVSVIDGDTLVVMYNGKQSKVRLIGIDAPESVHTDDSKNNEYGVIASNYTTSILSDVEYVYLEFDVSKYDTYNRLLAYVYTAEDDVEFVESINYVLVSEGYAINKEYEPNIKYADELLRACQEADIGEKGLWQYEEFEGLWH